MGEDCEYFRPGTAGYDPTYVYAGSKSVHRKGETDDEQDILIYNDDEDIVPLEVGKAYTVQFMMNVETTSNKNGKLYLVCTDKFDVNLDPVAVQSFTTLDKFEKGQWYQVTVSFIAQAKYLAFRTPGSSSIYFDNVAIYKGDSAGGAGNTGNSSSIGNVTIEGIDEQTGESNMIYTWITVLACSAAAAVVMLIMKRKADKAA